MDLIDEPFVLPVFPASCFSCLLRAAQLMPTEQDPAHRFPRLMQLWPILVIALLPLFLLGPCLLGDRTYLPFDLAQYPPIATELSLAQRAAIAAQPSNQDISDIPAVIVPELELASAELHAGRSPLWNPYARFGSPLLGNGLLGMLYPLNAILLLRSDPSAGLAMAAYLALLIAGILMYALLRELALGQAACLLGAMVFALGGTLTANAPFYMRLNALIWLPGMLHACLLIMRHRNRQRLGGCLGLSVCTAMSWLAGFPPYALVASLLTAGLTLFLCQRAWREAGAGAAVRLGAWILAAATVGIGISMMQILPMLDYFASLDRGQGQSANSIANQAFDPAGLLGLLMPELYGDPGLGSLPPYDRSPLVHMLFSRASWVAQVSPQGLLIPAGTPFFPQRYNFTEFTIYVGILPLLLALIGFRRSSVLRMPIIVLGLVFFTLASGPAWLAPIYALPGLNTIPPLRFIAALAPLLAVLAAQGLQELSLARHRRWWLLPLAGAITGMVMFGLAGWAGGDPPLHERSDQIGTIAARYAGRMPGSDLAAIRPIAEARFSAHLAAGNDRLIASLDRAAIVLLAGAVCLALWELCRRRAGLLRGITAVTLIAVSVELLHFALPLNAGRNLHRPRDTEVHRFLREQRDLHAGEGGITVARAAKQAGKLPIDLPVGMLNRERIRDLNGYTFLENLSPALFVALYGPSILRLGNWPLALPDDERLQRRVLDLIGLRFLLSSEELEHAGVRVGPELKGPQGAEFFIYERPDPLPRAFVVPMIRVLENQAEVLLAMVPDLDQEPEFDPLAAALVTPDQAILLAKPLGSGTAPMHRRVRFIANDPGEILLRIDAGTPGYLVLADADLPGWHASQNGEEIPFARGNLFMRILPVAAEAVEIRYSYRAPGLSAGLLVTGLALALLAAAGFGYLSSRRSGQSVEIPD